MYREFGDFQTPPGLVKEIIQCLYRTGRVWKRALEPTCGQGNFIAGLLECPSMLHEIQGIDLQEHHLQIAHHLATQSIFPVTLHRADIFLADLQADLHWAEDGPLLVIGNPPWVTNAELGALNSTNHPVKRNIKNLRGIDAATGGSNFDIAEHIIIKLITELAHERPAIAMLCKTLVARNVIEYLHNNSIRACNAFIRRIDAKKWFDVNVDACLFYLEIDGVSEIREIPIFADLTTTVPISIMGLQRGKLVSDISDKERWGFADGVSPVIWRQGVKHDAASIMELTRDSEGIRWNKLGEMVEIEEQFIFPLFKSSDLYNLTIPGKKEVIITQRSLGEETSHLAGDAPKLWEYLTKHAAFFDQRKSSIYNNQPRFSMFGIGDYSFAPYKVAVSGLYKIPRFRLVGSIVGQPVMLDDTCYFAPCSSAEQAGIIVALLSTPIATRLLEAIIFTDAKRPVTKKLLQRVDLAAILHDVDRTSLTSFAEQSARNTHCVSADWQPCWPDNLETLFIYPLKFDVMNTQISLF